MSINSNKDICIIVLSGDNRQEYLYTILKEHYSYVLNQVETESNSENVTRLPTIVAGPIPFGDCAGSEIVKLSSIYNIKAVFGGLIPDSIISYLEFNNIEVCDYLKDEKLVSYNAISTAEGAIAKAISEHPVNISDNSAIVIGYGRCGRIIAKYLKAIGCKVTVCVRSQNSFINSMNDGFATIYYYTLKAVISQYDFIFNTAPTLVINEDMLFTLNCNNLIIDIASKPGGIDYNAARSLGIKAIHLLSIPGIYSPKSSAQALSECINEYIGRAPWN